MDIINEGRFDQMMEDAFRSEPLAEVPVNFSQLFLEQVKVEAKPKFQVLSWVDMLFSMIMAFCIGIAFLIPVFLPEQLSPMMQWVLQWGGYLLTKAVFGLPEIIITIGAIVLAIITLFAGGKGMKVLINKTKWGTNLILHLFA